MNKAKEERVEPEKTNGANNNFVEFVKKAGIILGALAVCVTLGSFLNGFVTNVQKVPILEMQQKAQDDAVKRQEKQFDERCDKIEKQVAEVAADVKATDRAIQNLSEKHDRGQVLLVGLLSEVKAQVASMAAAAIADGKLVSEFTQRVRDVAVDTDFNRTKLEKLEEKLHKP